MTDYRIGCSGWSYKGWVGPFYPSRAKAGDFLKLYSKVLDTVEIDSTFYNTPGEFTVTNWKNSTPDDFVFSPKMPRQITHDNKLFNVEVLLDKFLGVIRNLGTKLGVILIQFPPSFTYDTGNENMKSFLKMLPSDLSFAIEFRHSSWFKEDVYSNLEKNNVTLAWSEIPVVKNPAVSTSSKIYLRLVGDRTISEENFGYLQKDKTEEINRWAKRLEERKDDISKAYIYSNNHFQGFGPGTVNLVREAIGLPLLDWASSINSHETEKHQKTLF